MLFERFADDGEEAISYAGSDDGKDDKFDDVHPAHTCWDRDEVSDDWDHASYKDGYLSFMFEKVFCGFEFFFIQ